MTDAFDWKTIYSSKMGEKSKGSSCKCYHLANETRTGANTAYVGSIA